MAEDSDAGLLNAIDKVVPDGWRKRAATAALQVLLGGRKAAALYQAGRDAQDTAEGRSIVSRALAQQIAAQALNDPMQLERAKARFLGKVANEQENLEAVISDAQRRLLSAPEPLQLEDADAENDEIKLDVDWVASFTREAEIATSESLRDRLASILAGEITSPGRYPKSVFRAIVELEKADIEAVRQCLPYRYGDTLFLGKMSAGLPQRMELSLQAAGLIDTNRFSHGGMPLRHAMVGGYRSDIIGFGQFGLLIESKAAMICQGTTIFLNRAGVAAFEVLDDLQSDEVAARFARTQAEPGMRIYLCKLTPKDGGFLYQKLATLHDDLDVE